MFSCMFCHITLIDFIIFHRNRIPIGFEYCFAWQNCHEPPSFNAIGKRSRLLFSHCPLSRSKKCYEFWDTGEHAVCGRCQCTSCRSTRWFVFDASLPCFLYPVCDSALPTIRRVQHTNSVLVRQHETLSSKCEMKTQKNEMYKNENLMSGHLAPTGVRCTALVERLKRTHFQDDGLMACVPCSRIEMTSQTEMAEVNVFWPTSIEYLRVTPFSKSS